MATRFVLGGARSGKSRFAVESQRPGARVVFVATAQPSDADMAARIARHRAERPSAWTTIEEPFDLAGCLADLPRGTEAVVVDCLTVWVANLLGRGDGDDAILAEARRVTATVREPRSDLTIVSNEVGEGVHPETAIGVRFRDLVGRVNQEIAASCETVVLMVAGVPLTVKADHMGGPETTPQTNRMGGPETAPQPPRPSGRPGEAVVSLDIRLAALIGAIRPVDPGALHRARRHLDELTKPPGSLGRLEDLAARLAALAGGVPSVQRPVIFTFAADHGVVAEGVSAYPQSVTAQMLENFLRGGAAINVLARQAGARLIVADFGVVTRVGPRDGLVERRQGPGTLDMARGPAMTRAAAEQAIHAGVELANAELDRGADLVATGEMGIGNTTAASAITAALTGRSPADVTGRGTGIDDTGLARKIEVIAQALDVNRPDPDDPVDVLAKVGGFEIAGLVGVILAAAARRVPVAVDGFISGAAALVAARLAPAARDAMFAAHRSAERGHTIVLDDLGLTPYLELGMRLGEGTGAALFVPLARAAAAIYGEMATFKSAGVDGRAAAGAESPEATRPRGEQDTGDGRAAAGAESPEATRPRGERDTGNGASAE